MTIGAGTWKAEALARKMQIGWLGPWELFTSELAIERDGFKTIQVRRSWRERLTTRPWRPWVTTKPAQVENWKPCIIRVGWMIVCHPSLVDQVRKAYMEVRS